ncbi:MAG: type I-A CRISPR-associated protein Cas7/Csa2 [Candidatus Jordarchaeales archaeon]
MFVSLGMRFLANIEALNAVESVGNVTKHRRAPIVVLDEKTGKYTIRYVPSISGESLGHAYQSNVVEFATEVYNGNPPVCKWCSRGEFFKSMSLKFTHEEAKKVQEERKSTADLESVKHEFEKAVIRSCLVEDIGGFLLAEEDFPVKRTSVFFTGYVVPTLDSLEATVIDTQFHARHAPVMAGKKEEKEATGKKEEDEVAGEEKQKKQKKEVAAQMIYYVEVASAVYGMRIDIDLDAIGRTKLVLVEDAVDAEERKKRVLCALGGLALTALGRFGAKRSRFNPISEVKSILVTVSDVYSFSVTPPHTRDYIAFTLKRANAALGFIQEAGLKGEIKLLAYDGETGVRLEGVSYFDTPEDLFRALINYVKENYLKQG